MKENGIAGLFETNENFRFEIEIKCSPLYKSPFSPSILTEVFILRPPYDGVLMSLYINNWSLTLRLLISYIYGAPSKSRNANVVYIWAYVWQR